MLESSMETSAAQQPGVPAADCLLDMTAVKIMCTITYLKLPGAVTYLHHHLPVMPGTLAGIP
jgi:hypothetical protein